MSIVSRFIINIHIMMKYMLESSQRYCKSLSSVLLLHLNRKSPNAELVNTMLDTTISGLKEDEHPIVHSDRGCHYRWPGWIQRMEKNHLIRSMSKKGCSPDNSACEGVFSLFEK